MTNNTETLAALFANIEMPAVEKLSHRLAVEFDERTQYEVLKNPANDSIQKTLKKMRGSLIREHAVRILIASNVSADFVNREINEGARFNVYTLGKISDIINCAVSGTPYNAVNTAIIRSLLRLEGNKIAATGKLMLAATSDKIRLEDQKVAKILVRHTVSESTASTQTSSTMSALQVLGVVKNSGTVKAPVYDLTDTPLTNRLREVYAIAA